MSAGGVKEREVGGEDNGVSLSVYRNLIPVMGVGAGGTGRGIGNNNNTNAVVVSFQGAGTRVETRWGFGCLVIWLGMVVAAL